MVNEDTVDFLLTFIRFENPGCSSCIFEEMNFISLRHFYTDPHIKVMLN